MSIRCVSLSLWWWVVVACTGVAMFGCEARVQEAVGVARAVSPKSAAKPLPPEDSRSPMMMAGAAGSAGAWDFGGLAEAAAKVRADAGAEPTIPEEPPVDRDTGGEIDPGDADEGETDPGEADPGETEIPDAGAATEDAGAASGACVRARKLWSDDFETSDYSRWTSGGYVSTLNQGGCFQSGFSGEQARGGSLSHRTSVGCASSANHRIYGGLQFSGDSVVPRYTNAGSGIDAPNGIVVTYWSWLDAPGFGNGRWFSFFTTQNMCNWGDTVLTFGLEDPSNQIAPAHHGSVQYTPTRVAFPFRKWARTTVYVNYYAGEFHVWQDGISQMHGSFRRRTNQICQFHWGLYANGANDAITLFEDDFSIWKLEQPLEDFDAEPWFGETQSVCE